MPNSKLKMAYIPMGPYTVNLSMLDNLWELIDERVGPIAKLLKWEPGIYTGDISDFEKWGFRPSQEMIQPPRSIVIDLSGSEEGL